MNRLEYKPFKGLEIRCFKCNKTIHNDWKPKNGCRHPISNTAYRAIVIVPGTQKKRYSKKLESRTYSEAVKECIDFRTDVLNGMYQKNTLKEQAKPQLVIDCIWMYIDFLADVDVPEHMKKRNSEDYIISTRSHFNTYKQFLEAEKINTNLFKVTDVDSNHVGKYFSYLTEKSGANYTFNHRVKVMRALFEYLKEEKKYKIENPFKEIKLKPEKGKDVTVTREDFYALLEIITPTDAVMKIGKSTKRNMYRSWLKDAYKLKAFTGRRDDEIFYMKWNMIHFERGKPIYIQTPNLKINRLKNQYTSNDMDYVFVPVIEELEFLLIDLGLQFYRSSNEYIIAPECTSREAMVTQASKSFTFYWKKLNLNYDIRLKHLRSTYITASEIYSFRQGPKLKQHANYRVTDKHYNDQTKIAEFISKDRSKYRFVVFPN